MKTLFTLTQSVKTAALGKGLLARERKEEGKNHYAKQLNIITSLDFFLIVFLCIYFETSVFGGLSWLCLSWILHQAAQPSSGLTTLYVIPFIRQAERDLVSCIIHKLTAWILQVITSPIPIAKT